MCGADSGPVPLSSHMCKHANVYTHNTKEMKKSENTGEMTQPPSIQAFATTTKLGDLRSIPATQMEDGEN